MGEKTRYSEEELKEFEEMILEKLQVAKKELDSLVSSLSKKNDSGTDSTTGAFHSLDDGSEALEKERMNQLAVRQNKFIDNLEKALVRIKNGTYGICVTTGKLISKERLKAVPHTTQSIEAKLSQNK